MSTNQRTGLVRFADFRPVPGGFRQIRCEYIPPSDPPLPTPPFGSRLQHLTVVWTVLAWRGSKANCNCNAASPPCKTPNRAVSLVGRFFFLQIGKTHAISAGSANDWPRSPGFSVRPADGGPLLRFPAFRGCAGKRGLHCACAAPSDRPAYRCQSRDSSACPGLP